MADQRIQRTVRHMVVYGYARATANQKALRAINDRLARIEAKLDAGGE